MAVIQTLGQVENIAPPWWQGIRRSGVRLYDRLNYEYSVLYRLQPNVRTCVDFLSRNVAQLGLHQFKRVSDTDRIRLSPADFGMTRLLARPMPPQYKITRYRLIESIMGDLGIYFNSYLLKIRDENGIPSALLRIPPQFVYTEGGLLIKKYELRLGLRPVPIDPEEIIHFRGYNPEDPTAGLSQLETLRRILAEEDSAGKYREEMWQNGVRNSGFLERPPDAPEWSDEARKRFIEEFNDLYSGEGKGGSTAILEDGMKWISAGFNAREAEYLGGRKLTREECARAYHIPLPMVGILDNATFSNIREQHKQLYQDCIGPHLASIEQDFDLQLLPDFAEEDDIDLIYTEFNIMEKLSGDFEEQIKALQSAIGRPYMTPNEGRGRLNLPAIDSGDADQLATPLNVTVGGLASPRDTGPKMRSIAMKSKSFDSHSEKLRENFQRKWAEILTDYFSRQERSILSKIPPSLELKTQKGDIGAGVWWDSERWDRELQADLIKFNLAAALAWADVIFFQTGLELEEGEIFQARMIPYIETHSRIQAEKINQTTQADLSAALNDPDPLEAAKKVFRLALAVRVFQQAITAVTSMASFGAHEAARASSLTKKIWRVNSNNPRDSHRALDGESVGIRELFSNGLRWPGDSSAGDADEIAGCQCSVEFE